MLAGLKGFEEVADRWEEGIGRTEDLRNSHTLDALGGRRIWWICQVILIKSVCGLRFVSHPYV